MGKGGVTSGTKRNSRRSGRSHEAKGRDHQAAIHYESTAGDRTLLPAEAGAVGGKFSRALAVAKVPLPLGKGDEREPRCRAHGKALRCSKLIRLLLSTSALKRLP